MSGRRSEKFLESVRKDARSFENLKYATEECKNDKDIVLDFVRRSGYSLQHASKTLRDDEDVVLAAVMSRGSELQYGSEKCRNNPSIVLEAVKQNGHSLRYSGEDCRKNRKIVLEAAKCKIGIESLKYAAWEILNDKDFILEVVLHNEEAYSFFGYHLNSIVFKEVVIWQGNIEKSLYELSRRIHKTEIEKILREDICFTVAEEILKMKMINRKISSNFRGMSEEEEKYNVCKLRNELKEKKFSDLVFYRNLGSGAFGTTYLCRFKDGIGVFVVKIYHDVNLSSRRVERESLFLDYHRNLVSIIHHSDNETIDLEKLPDYENRWKDFFHSPIVTGCGMLLMNFYQQDLRFVMEKKYLRPQEICSFMFQILQGCNFLNENMIVHRDLHCGNIFVSEDYKRVWVGDFGCILDLRNNEPKGSFKVNKKDEMMFSVTTGNTFPSMNLGGDSAMAPEIRSFNSEEDKYLDYSKSDVYSIGLIGNILLKKYQKRSRAFEKTISEMGKIFEKMMETNPLNRDSFTQSIKKMKRILM